MNNPDVVFLFQPKKALLRFIKSEKVTTKQRMLDNFHVFPATLRKHLDEMIKDGVIEKHLVEKREVYYARPKNVHRKGKVSNVRSPGE